MNLLCEQYFIINKYFALFQPRFVDIQPHQFDPVGEEEVSEDDGEPRESREQVK